MCYVNSFLQARGKLFLVFLPARDKLFLVFLTARGKLFLVFFACYKSANRLFCDRFRNAIKKSQNLYGKK